MSDEHERLLREIQGTLLKQSVGYTPVIDEPFGRQPRPVLVTVTGDDQRDVDVAIAKFIRVAESAGDMTQRTENHFWIYPRAVND